MAPPSSSSNWAPIQLMSLPPATAVHRRMFVSCSTASSRSPLNTKAGSSTKICVEALGSIADSVRPSHAAKRPHTVGLLAAPNTRVSKTCSSSCGLRFGFAAVKANLSLPAGMFRKASLMSIAATQQGWWSL